ncbi:MAG: ABC transporter permease [Anaerolineae bacterium]
MSAESSALPFRRAVGDALRPYAATLNARLQTALQYRVAAWAGVVTQVFWGLMRIMLFAAFYRSSAASQPMTFPQIVDYVWLGQALLGLQPWYVDGEIQALIRSGDMAFELLRPVDLYTYWYCRDLARRTGAVLLRAVPQVIIAALFFGFHAPASWEAGLAFALTLVGAFLLTGSIATLATIAMLFTLAGDGVRQFLGTVGMMFSGLIVPLAFLPPWVERLSLGSPFAGINDVPFRFYVGMLELSDLPLYLGLQIGWTLAFVVAGRLLLGYAQRRIVVQGG